jgi:hypothetical protein
VVTGKKSNRPAALAARNCATFYFCVSGAEGFWGDDHKYSWRVDVCVIETLRTTQLSSQAVEFTAPLWEPIETLEI